jgi:ubiquitin carboxyl-terminal hydrolase 34
VDYDEGEELTPRIPVLNPATRNIMAEMVYFLVKDDETQYRAILVHLSALVPYSPLIEDGMFEIV